MASFRGPDVLSAMPSATAGLTATSALSAIPGLSSRSSAFAKLYLDFDGDTTTSWGTYSPGTTPAYDADGNASSFNETELANITEIWQRVAEKYSPFNLDVTTIDPGNLNDNQTLHIVIGGNGAWAGSGLGGTAYTGGFSSPSSPNTVFVFSSNLGNGNPSATAENSAHEAGHGFGLRHQNHYSGSSFLAEYNPGDAQRAPIMGESKYSARGLWWLGPTTVFESPVIQDDLAILAHSNNGFGYRPDDHGGGWADKSAFSVSGATLNAAGVIERTVDVDSFGFTTTGGSVSFTAAVAQFGPMLDLSIAVQDSSGNVLASSATSSLGESLSVSVAAGTYRLVVYSAANYGDIGQYTISGILPASEGTPPVANPGGPYAVNEGGSVALSGSSSTGTGLTYTWDLDGDGVYGETSAGATRGAETGATPTFSAAGLDGTSSRTVSLRVTDSEARTSTATAMINVANVAPALTISGNNSVNEGATYTLNLSKSDPGLDTISQWVINWGDGNSQTVTGNPASVAHDYGDNGSYTISATATDEDGTYSANTKAVTVANVVPTLAISGNASVLQDASYTLNFSSSDPGSDTISQWTINWGDGNTQVVTGNPSTATHIFTAAGEYSITATATDEDGTYAAAAPVSVNVFVLQTSTPTATVGTLPPITANGDGTYSFNVTYGGTYAIVRASIDATDVRVTGPGGFQQLAELVSVSSASDATPLTATYRITIPGSMWTEAHNGDYTIALQAGQVRDIYNTYALAATLGSFNVTVPPGDSGAPTASLIDAPPVTAAGDGTYTFGVKYLDAFAISRATLDNQDVIVFGPNGLELLAKLVKISHAWDRAPMTVYYRISVPGGAWTNAHNGVYSINVRAQQVYDTSGHSVAAGTIGTFTVSAPAPDYAGNDRQTAKNLGSVSPGKIRVALDWVSAADIQDYYKFNVTTRSSVSFKVTEMTADVSLQVRSLSNTLIANSARSGTQQESLTLTMNAGTYYARIISADGIETPYRLRIAGEGAVASVTTSSASLFSSAAVIRLSSASAAAMLEASAEWDSLIATR
jgi:hypothetical protein